jgi:hypothetical protein
MVDEELHRIVHVARFDDVVVVEDERNRRAAGGRRVQLFRLSNRRA